MTVADLSSYRERRTVRRVGAYALIAIAVLAMFSYLQDALAFVDSCIRTAANLLPEEENHDGDA